MSLLAIEINDAGLTAVSESGVVFEAEGINMFATCTK